VQDRAILDARKAGVEMNVADAMARAESDIAAEKEQARLRAEAARAAEEARREKASQHQAHPAIQRPQAEGCSR
jgi:hypothetical protein